MFKSIAKISTLIILIMITSVIVLYWQTSIISNIVKDFLNSELEGVAKIEYSDLSGNLIEQIRLTDIEVLLADSSTISAKSINIEYNLVSVIFQPYLVRDLIIDGLNVNLVESEQFEKESTNKDFTINDIPGILDSLIEIDSVLAVFPELIVNNLEIKNSNIKISDQLQFENVELNLKYAFESEELDVVIEKLTGTWKNYNLSIERFQTALNANRNRITLNQFQVETNKSHLYAKFEFSFDEQNWIIFDLEDSHIDYLEFSELFKFEEIKWGWINSSIQVVGSPNNLSAQLEINGETDVYDIDSLIVDCDFKDNVLSVLTGKILINDTYLTFKGKGSVESSYGRINFKKFDVSKLIPDAIKTSLTGNISFDVAKLDLNHLNGSGEIFLENSIVDSVKIDSLRFALLAVDNNFDIVNPSILKFSENSMFTVRGNLKRNLMVDAELFTENNNIAQLFSALNFDTLHGSFDANLHLFGNISDPDLTGYLFLPFIAKDSIVLDTILLELQLNKIFSGRKGNAHFSVNKGNISGFELTEALVTTRFDSNIVQFDTLHFANGENFISLAGKLSQFQDTVRLGFDLFRIYYQGYWIENSDSILLNFFPDEYVINQARFKSPGEGVLELRGYWDNTIQDIQLGLYVENMRLDPFQQFYSSEMKVDGVLNGEVLLIDALNNPVVESEVKGEHISLTDSDLGNVSLKVEYDNGNIYFEELILKKDQTEFNASGDIAIKYNPDSENQKIDFIEGTKTNLKVNWKNFDLNNYQQILKLKDPVKGASSGEISITGTIKNPQLSLNMAAQSINYEKYNLKNFNLQTHYKDGFIVLDTLFTDINETSIQASGSQRIDVDLENMKFEYLKNPLKLNIYSKDDRIEFIGNFLDQVEKITGEYEFALHINGTPEKPKLKDGFFNINNGTMVLSRVKNPIKDLTINASIDSSILTFENMSAYSKKEKDLLETGWSYIVSFFRLFKGETTPEGQLLGEGTIDLSNPQSPNLNLNLSMYEFFVDYFVENTQLVLTSDQLNITGRDTIFVEGDIIVENGNYAVDLEKLRKNIYLASSEIEAGKAVSWNLEINIPDNFTITSSVLDLVNNFELEISGNLRSIQEPNQPSMELTGQVEILSGNYAAFGQNFEIQEGSISFSDPKKINPDIEIFALKETGDYTVELTVNGNLERLMQDLQIRDNAGTYLSNLSLYDKLMYISGSGDGSLVSTGEDVINTSVETVFERGAQDLIGLDKVKINNSDGVVDLQSMKLNNGLEDASISIGKNLTNNLYIEYRSQFGSGVIPAPKLSWEPGNQISLAYKINKFWSVESAYAQTLKGNTLINISLAWKTTF